MKNHYLSRTFVMATFIVATVIATVLPATLVAAPFDAGTNMQRAERLQLRLKMLERYLQVVESVHSIADNPEKTVLFQLQQLEDLYKRQRNPQKVISLYQDILKSTPNVTVRNAASMKLVQLLKRVGKESEAEQLTRNSLEENLKRLK